MTRSKRTRRLLAGVVCGAGLVLVAVALLTFREAWLQEWYLYRFSDCDETTAVDLLVALRNVGTARAIPAIVERVEETRFFDLAAADLDRYVDAARNDPHWQWPDALPNSPTRALDPYVWTVGVISSREPEQSFSRLLHVAGRARDVDDPALRKILFTGLANCWPYVDVERKRTLERANAELYRILETEEGAEDSR